MNCACKVKKKTIFKGKKTRKISETANNLFASGNADSANMPTETIKAQGQMNILDFLASLSIISSKSEARRLLEQNGIMINNEKKNNMNEMLDMSQKEFIVKKGKKTFVKVIVE